MEGFTLSMALVDAVPVLLFGGGTLIIADKLGSPLFIAGALLCFAGGLCKVLWKLVLALRKRNVSAITKPAFPMMIFGLTLMLIAVIVNLPGGRLSLLLRFPAGLFLGLCFMLLMAMGVYRKKKFDNSARANWTAQIVNCLAQLCLLLAAFFMA